MPCRSTSAGPCPVRRYAMSPAKVRILRLLRASGAIAMSSVVIGGDTVGVGASSRGDGGAAKGAGAWAGARAGACGDGGNEDSAGRVGRGWLCPLVGGGVPHHRVLW